MWQIWQETDFIFQEKKQMLLDTRSKKVVVAELNYLLRNIIVDVVVSLRLHPVEIISPVLLKHLMVSVNR